MERRTFLTAAAAGIAGTLGFRGASATEPTGLKKCLKYGMIRVPGGLTEKFRAAKAAGFAGVELACPNEFRTEDVLAARDEVGIELPGTVGSVHWKARLSDPSAEVRGRGVAALKEAIVDSAAYGATTTLLVPGRVTEDASYQECWDRSIAEIRKLIPLAEEHGIVIGIENVWNDFLTDPKEFARYLDEIDSPWVKAYFDVGNTLRYSPPETWVPVLGKRIVKLDIKEYGAEKRFDYPLGEGDVDWPAVRREIAKIGYSGWCSAEMRGGDQAYLTDLSRRMDRVLAIS